MDRKKRKRSLENETVASLDATPPRLRRFQNISHPPNARHATRERAPKNTKQTKVVERVSARDAAEIIRARATRNNRSAPPLVLITTDASGNGSVSGLAAIVRRIEPSSNFVQVALGHLPWDESLPAEIGAGALGLKHALPQLQSAPCDVLLVMDCIGALNFYDSNQECRFRELYQDAETWLSSMAPVLEAANRVMIVKVRSNHTKHSGFFDHEAADLLSATARDKEKADIVYKSTAQVPPLNETDIQWLADSDEHGEGGKNKKLKKSGGSGPRKQRCKARIKCDFHIKVEY